ncbi:helix-turn-helix domain-containing protein, partial [Brevibacillus borstelensis]
MSRGVRDFYTIQEVSKKLNSTEKHLYKLASEKRLMSCKAENKTVFDKEEIDRIEELLKDTYSYKEIVEIVRNETGFKNVVPETVKKYMELHFGLNLNPLNAKDYRLYKKDKPQLVQVIKENYRELKREEDVLTSVIRQWKDELGIIDDGLNNKKYYDFTFLKEYSRQHSLSVLRDNKSVLTHIWTVCKEQGIPLLTDRRFSNVYLAVTDFREDQQYYEKRKNFDPDIYYSNAEVKEMFGIVNTDGLAEYANAFQVKGKLYFSKEKINELKFIQENTVTKKEVMEKYDIPHSTMMRYIDKLGCIWQAKNAEFGNHFVHSLARL